MESYAHKAAKEVVATWFRAAATGHEDDYVEMLGFSWRVNRGGPHFGVHLEYPILADGTGVELVWDEVLTELDEPPPSYADLIGRGTPPAAILDVAVQHKGMVILGIEIVHKNPPSVKKQRFLHSTGIGNLLVLPARWVLGQIKPPNAVPVDFWYWGRNARTDGSLHA